MGLAAQACNPRSRSSVQLISKPKASLAMRLCLKNKQTNNNKQTIHFQYHWNAQDSVPAPYTEQSVIVITTTAAVCQHYRSKPRPRASVSVICLQVRICTEGSMASRALTDLVLLSLRLHFLKLATRPIPSLPEADHQGPANKALKTCNQKPPWLTWLACPVKNQTPHPNMGFPFLLL